MPFLVNSVGSFIAYTGLETRYRLNPVANRRFWKYNNSNFESEWAWNPYNKKLLNSVAFGFFERHLLLFVQVSREFLGGRDRTTRYAARVFGSNWQEKYFRIPQKQTKTHECLKFCPTLKVLADLKFQKGQRWYSYAVHFFRKAKWGKCNESTSEFLWNH